MLILPLRLAFIGPATLTNGGKSDKQNKQNASVFHPPSASESTASVRTQQQVARSIILLICGRVYYLVEKRDISGKTQPSVSTFKRTAGLWLRHGRLDLVGGGGTSS